MDRRARLNDLARRLRRAASAADWSALGAIDRELAHVLRWTPPTWSSPERAALEAVRRAHGEARELCAHETARVDKVLSQMRRHRDGWMAYALSDSNDPEAQRR